MADKGQTQSSGDKDGLTYSGGLGRREYDPSQGRYVEVNDSSSSDESTSQGSGETTSATTTGEGASTGEASQTTEGGAKQ